MLESKSIPEFPFFFPKLTFLIYKYGWDCSIIAVAYCAYGGVFIVLSVLWGWGIDKKPLIYMIG